ncbi:TetR/AcrR family transcriptional regulator [Streptomyces avicenniae]|uniref:TetR/AcrR family transcriptional regulator n=1 Tax=Streptomyces avicenniae TaxID=500153 RepID=UPI00069B531E|nr:TetR/AcrR family transcriptional regulator [Streptomyces avicenniae]
MPVAKGARLDPARTRAEILRAATALFYAHGLDGIGVAELCARAGISKETLYRHFGSKDGLVEAVLEARSDRTVHWLERAAEAAGDDPERQLAAVFDALEGWYGEPAFRGCAVVNAAIQHREGPALGIAVRHLVRYHDLLTGIAARAGAADPAAVGAQLLYLLEGATVVAGHQGGDGARGPTGQAKAAALTLLRAAR